MPILCCSSYWHSFRCVSFIHQVKCWHFFQLMTNFFGSNFVWRLKIFSHLMFNCQTRHQNSSITTWKFLITTLNFFHLINGGLFSTIDAMAINIRSLPKKFNCLVDSCSISTIDLVIVLSWIIFWLLNQIFKF